MLLFYFTHKFKIVFVDFLPFVFSIKMKSMCEFYNQVFSNVADASF